MNEYYNILDKFRDHLEAQSNIPTVHLRRRINASTEDQLPCVVIAPERDVVTDYSFGQNGQIIGTVKYGIWVCYIEDSLGQLEEGLATSLLIRQLIRNAAFTFKQTYVDWVIDINVTPNPPIDKNSLVYGLMNSPILVQITIAEEFKGAD